MTDKLHMYQKIYDTLLQEINCNQYPVGSMLPTEKELCQRYRVSRITSKRALDMLSQEGIITRTKGRGSVVQKAQSAAVPPAPPEGKGTLLGLVMPDFSDTFGIEMIYGIGQACDQHGCSFILKRSCGDLATEKRCIVELTALGVGGIAVMPLHGEYYNEGILKLIIEGFPIVILDRLYPGINGSFVGTDNEACAKTATEYLLDLGHRNIAWVSPNKVQTSTLEDRVKGFSKALTERNVSRNRRLWFTELCSTLPTRNTPDMIEADIRSLVRHFQMHPEITAVFAAEYNIAMLVQAAAQEMGLSVPRDLSILCFDAPNTFGGKQIITHIKQKEGEIGQKSVELLMQMISRGRERAFQKVMFPGTLVIGNSTAAPKA